VPVRGRGAQPHAHRDHGARRAPPGRRDVPGGPELCVPRARAQGVPGTEQPGGVREKRRVRGQVPRARVRRRQRVRPAGARRICRGHGGRAQGGRG